MSSRTTSPIVITASLAGLAGLAGLIQHVGAFTMPHPAAKR